MKIIIEPIIWYKLKDCFKIKYWIHKLINIQIDIEIIYKIQNFSYLLHIQKYNIKNKE